MYVACEGGLSELGNGPNKPTATIICEYSTSYHDGAQTSTWFRACILECLYHIRTLSTITIPTLLVGGGDSCDFICTARLPLFLMLIEGLPVKLFVSLLCIHININISTFMFELQITLIECFDYSNSSDYSYTSFFVGILMNPVKGNSASQKKLLLTLQLSITKLSI